MSEAGKTCEQTVLPDDDCCAAEEICGQPGAWIHRPTGAVLCELHEQNARRYVPDSGRWGVGRLLVTYPEGWEPLTTVTAAPPALEVVHFES